MKRLKTSVASALEKGQIKKGDKILLEVEVFDFDNSDDFYIERPLLVRFKNHSSWINKSDTILIPKPEKKPIDFAAEGRVLKVIKGTTIVKTTGLVKGDNFSAYVLESIMYDKGHACDKWAVEDDWQDITDTYQP